MFRRLAFPKSITTSFSSFAKDSFVYLIGTLMLGLGNFVLVPLYTRYLSPSEFGVYALIDISLITFTTVAQLGLNVAYLKWYAEIDHSERGRLLGSIGVVSSVSTALGGLVLTLYALSSWGIDWRNTIGTGFVWTLLPIVILEVWQAILLTDLRAQRNPIGYSAAMVSRLLVIVISSIWMIVYADLGALGIFGGRLLGNLWAVGVLGFLSCRSIRLRFDWQLARPMIRYGLPVMIAGVMSTLLDLTGRFALEHFSGLEQVGYFAIALKVSGIFQMLIVQPFGIAWGGVMFQIAQQPQAQLIYSKILSYSVVLGLQLALSLAAVTPLIFAIFASEAYLPAMPILPVILLIRAVNLLMYPAAIGIYLTNRTDWLVPIYSTALVTNLIANWLLTPTLGVYGATWAWLFSWFVIIFLLLAIGQKFYPLTIDWKMILFPIIVWGVVMYYQTPILSWLTGVHWVGQFGLAFAIAMITVALLGLNLKGHVLYKKVTAKVTLPFF